MDCKPTEPSTCLVVLTDSLYLPGTQRLLSSWSLHNPALPVIALSTDADVLQDPYLVDHCAQRIHIDPSDYDEIQPYKKRHSQRHGKTFYKFEAFADFGYDRNLFLDSDILCLCPAPDLLIPSTHSLLAAPDTGFKPTRAYKGHPNEINSGVLVIDISIQGSDTISQLKQIATDNPGRGGYNSGDQGILNKWIHEFSIDLGLLPSEYNRIKKDYADTSDLESTRLLHYAGGKPWFDSNEFSSKEPLAALWHKHP